MSTNVEVNEMPERNWGAEEWRAPEIGEGEAIVYSECGRIVTYGETERRVDCRSHYFRVVKRPFGGHDLLVKHGGGTERIELRDLFPVSALAAMSSDDRYKLLHALYDMHSDGRKQGLAIAKRRQDAEIEAGTLKRHRPRRKKEGAK